MKFLIGICIIGLLSFSVNIYSQNDRYIEVVAIDTVVLKAISFTYEITSDGSSDVMAIFSQQMETLEGDIQEDYKPVPSLFEIATMLKKEKFDLSFSKTSKSPLSPKSDSSIVVVVKTEAELERLKIFLDDESVNGSMKEVLFESVTKYQRKPTQIYTIEH